MATTYGYLAGGHGTGSTTPLVQTITQSGATLTYAYDDAGNITSVSDGVKTIGYAYDLLGQLIRANDPYGSLDEEESQFDCTHPFLPLAVCPKCQSSEFQLHFDFEYPELNELDILGISRPDKAFIWIWISLTCSHCRSVFHCNLETD